MRIFLFLLLAAPPFLQAADKTPPLSIRLHAETGPEEGKSFVTPITLFSPPKETYIRKVPIITENDIVAFHAFPGKDGTIAAYFQLDRDGTHKLEGHTTASRDTVVVALVNGRVASALRVDRKITDGILYVPGGIRPHDILQMQARFPMIGKEKSFKAQKKQATLALKEQARQEKAAAKAEKAKPAPTPKKKKP